jgi:nitrite reductase/ring-hydroxylating ferredoxin subunit
MKRREMLVFSVLSGCGVGCALLGCGGGVDGPAAAVSEQAVPLSAVPAGGFYASIGESCGSAGGGFIVGRDSGGIYAYSSTCTHLAGIVPLPDSSGVSTCCLHGSQFDRNGDLRKGVVAGQGSLRHFKVRLSGSGADATVWVDLGQEEPDRAARVAIPS